jgi:hypothetical protein
VFAFFPEGGTVITRATSAVGFRITDDNGVPLPLSGYLKDNCDSVVSRFPAGKNGLGRFEFYPYRFRKYTALLNGTIAVYPFPPINPRVAQLSIVPIQEGQRKLRVLLKDSLYTPQFTTYILGISKDSLCFAASGTGNHELQLPEDAFPAGVATLFYWTGRATCSV